MKYKHTLLIAAAIAGLSSCKKDFLDTKIDKFTTPESIASDRGSLYTFANAFYTQLPYGFNALDNNLFAAASDEAQQTSAFANSTLAFNQGTLSDINLPAEVDAYYKNMYDGIRAANFYIDYSKNWREFIARGRDTLAASEAVSYPRDKQFIGWYRGEARVVRAYYYSELIKRYGDVPLITKNYNPGEAVNLTKAKYDDVVNFIVSQIDTYKDSLQVNWRTSAFTDQDGRFTKGVALAIKSRVLLYAASPLHNPSNDLAKWQRAAEAARDVMTTTGLNYSLYTGGYGNYFLENNSLSSNETILAVRRPADQNPEKLNYPISTPGGGSGIAPSQNLVSDYELNGAADPADPYKNRDPRLGATVVTNGSSWNGRVIDQSAGGSDDMSKANTSKTGYYLKKFLSSNLNLTNGGTARHNWILFRYAEILLNYAEAMNEVYGADAVPAGYTKSARQALNEVRARVGVNMPAVTAATGTPFRNAIKHERRIELAFEDHRYWDLLRWKDAETVLNQPVTGVKVTKTAPGVFTYQTANVSTRVFRAPVMYLFPFSRTEVVNSNGTLIQNSGY